MTKAMSDPLVIDGVLTIPGTELSWTAVRASGPGGQNVNKVASKVELRYDLASSRAIPEQVKARLRVIARSRLDAEGQLLVTSQLTRDRVRNLDDARAKLVGLVKKALLVPPRRKATRPTLGSKRRRLEGKRRQAEKKTARRATED
jgi:ribosome-associated protein